MSKTPRYVDDVAECVDATLQRLGGKIVLALPIGVGKAIPVANEFYRRAQRDPAISLKIFTALSLRKPQWHSELERRFLQPLVERVFGGTVELDYVRDLHANTLPANVQVIEFFFEPGASLNVAHSQRHYVSSNYTHVARDLLRAGVNVMAQLVARSGPGGRVRYSFGSNPDISVDLLDALAAQGAANVVVIGEVNRQMPFMFGAAEVEAETFDFILEHPRYEYDLFAPPNTAIATVDYAIGLHAAALVRDGGTLQLGIGALGDAVAYCLQLRHQQNGEFREIIQSLGISERFADEVGELGGEEVFEEGLYGCTEMLVDGFIDLYRSGVLKRRVYPDLRIQQLLSARKIGEQVDERMLCALADRGLRGTLSAADFGSLQRCGVFRSECRFDEGNIIGGEALAAARLDDAANRARLLKYCTARQLSGGVLLHGGFFLGPRGFYAALRDMPEPERRQFEMCGIAYINDLYGDAAVLKAAQRRDSRFINTTMMVSLLGASTADALADGRVVSGVGGQYNFVAMGHALPGARTILVLRSTRGHKDKLQSNILWNYAHTTIPRHLRDVVVTEYGIADLRGKTDEQVIVALLNIADSRFQENLRLLAVRAGKLSADHAIPAAHRDNHPGRLERRFALARARGLFSEFPFGTDLTAQEIELAKALTHLKQSTATLWPRIRAVAGAVLRARTPAACRPALERMGLQKPASRQEWLWQRLLVRSLEHSSD